MGDCLTALIEAVEAADSSERLLRAVENLAAARLQGAIPTLIETLSYNNPGAAVAAVEGLIHLGEAAVPALMEQLDRHNYTARAWTIRALAGIGDPRGLVTLLEAATTDFAPSVRRGAARGLGNLNWSGFPTAVLRERAQAETLAALLGIAQEDEEWVVRYAAIVGLQTLGTAIPPSQRDWQSQIQTVFGQVADQDQSLTVQARALMAQQHLAEQDLETDHGMGLRASVSPLSQGDCQTIQEALKLRKTKQN
jgi:phycocyanobilin lyase beta subunit